jgi:endonuclease YncB( thermonuclease family)
LDATRNDGDDVPWFNLDGMLLRCKVVAVYDGDTITIVFPFEGKAWREKCRLTGIDTPEIRTKNEAEKAAALRARDWLRGEVLGQKLWVRCGRWDKFGRLLGTLYRERDDATTQQRPSLNDELIARGLAVAYDGGTKAVF